jgi:large subunit ribosomal protein L29
MSLPKIKEARELSDAALAEQILAVKRQLMELRLQQATGRMEKPHLFKHAKHRVAQLMTVERITRRSCSSRSQPRVSSSKKLNRTTKIGSYGS